MRVESSRGTGELLRLIARTEPQPARAIADRGLVPLVPQLAAMAGVPQDPRWHPEGDVLTHCLMAADAAAMLCAGQGVATDRRELLVLAALLHDVGKPGTTRELGGRIVSFGHAELGERLVRIVGAELDWPDAVTEPVAALVRHHMAHVSVVGDPSRRAVARLRSRLEAADTSLEEWAIVVHADGAARASASVEGRAEPWLRVASVG